MKHRATKIIVSLLSFFGSLLAALRVLAQVQISTNIPGASSAASNPIEFISNFYNFALSIGGILAFGAIVYGGFKYAISAGNPTKQSDAKSWITDALWGLLLLFSAYLILHTINPNLVNLNLPTLEPLSVSTGGGGGGGGLLPPGSPPLSCMPLSVGPGSADALKNTCFGSNADMASGIARGKRR
jgi:hypothetical protein